MSTTDEPVDQKGLVKRKRVIDQTIFDALLIKGYIELPEHEAVHKFIDAVGRSGSAIQSLDPSTFNESRAPRMDRGESAANKRMIFSAAFRSMHESCDESTTKLVMHWCHSPYSYPKKDSELKALGAMMLPGLRALARHYGCSTRDPRRVIRSQVYS